MVRFSFRDKKVCPEVTATDTPVLMETADLISVFKKLSISVNQRRTRQSELERDQTQSHNADVRSIKLKKKLQFKRKWKVIRSQRVKITV